MEVYALYMTSHPRFMTSQHSIQFISLLLSPSRWTGWISLQSKGLSRVFSNTTVQIINFSVLSFLHSSTLTSIHGHWKNHSLDQMDLVGKVMSLLFNMLSRWVITFLPRSKRLLISWLQSPPAVILVSVKLYTNDLILSLSL